LLALARALIADPEREGSAVYDQLGANPSQWVDYSLEVTPF
jgi:hypothetical protein